MEMLRQAILQALEDINITHKFLRQIATIKIYLDATIKILEILLLVFRKK